MMCSQAEHGNKNSARCWNENSGGAREQTFNSRKTRMFKHTFGAWLRPRLLYWALFFFRPAQTPTPPEPAAALSPKPGAINFAVRSPNERMEMTVHSSRIITIGQKIPQAQVNNPEILDLTPLQPTQVQVSAKTAGVTQINLWGEDQKLFTIDVIVLRRRSRIENDVAFAVPQHRLERNIPWAIRC